MNIGSVFFITFATVCSNGQQVPVELNSIKYIKLYEKWFFKRLQRLCLER